MAPTRPRHAAPLATPAPAPSPSPPPFTPTPTILDAHGFNTGPWHTHERHAIYVHLNTWLRTHGLDAYMTKRWRRAELTQLTRLINSSNAARPEPVPPRAVAGVRRYIRELGRGRLGPLAKLARRSKALKSEVEAGKGVRDAERFPEMGIPVPGMVGGVYVVGSTVEKNEAAAAKRQKKGEKQEKEQEKQEKQKKQAMVKLSVDWTRLHVGKDGNMSVLEQGEVWESSQEDGKRELVEE
ncbi:hypothetical protein EJ07DRAFT_183501 [Lizonia empirigonia]|nr:hypothetical protein EJ07DRAFT_183501 [Lizonia empirigonia]